MKTRNLCWLAMSLAAPMAQASIQLDTISCSSSLSISDQNGISFACGGDLALSGGTVSADEGDLLISAVGSLSLSNIWLNAANIKLSAESIYLGESVGISNVEDAAGSVVLNTPLILISPSGRIEFSPASPSDITLRPRADLSASIVDRPPIIAGRDIIAPRIRLQPGGEIVIQPGGALVIQGTPLVVPVPAAFTQFLLGLMAVILPTIRRKKISPRSLGEMS